MIDIFNSEDREIFHCVFSVSHSLLYNYHLFTEGPQNTLLSQGLSK